jgi:hypothetical protein
MFLFSFLKLRNLDRIGKPTYERRHTFNEYNSFILAICSGLLLFLNFLTENFYS